MMPIWEPVPLGHDPEDWRISEFVSKVVVRTPDEESAREYAGNALDRKAVKRQPGILTPQVGMNRCQVVSCHRIKDPHYLEEGPEEILNPTKDDSFWSRLE